MKHKLEITDPNLKTGIVYEFKSLIASHTGPQGHCKFEAVVILGKLIKDFELAEGNEDTTAIYRVTHGKEIVIETTLFLAALDVYNSIE